MQKSAAAFNLATVVLANDNSTSDNTYRTRCLVICITDFHTLYIRLDADLL